MSRLVLYMAMSLDGFIAGPDDRPGQELGRAGGRLFNWLDDRGSDGPNGQVYREALATRAVISGRRTFELAGRWQGDHHDGVPIFVLTHHVDEDDVPPGSARFVTDVDECAERARAAAGGRDVLVHGAGAAQALLRAGQLDEIAIQLVQVLLGGRAAPVRRPRPGARRARTGPGAARPRRHAPAVPGAALTRHKGVQRLSNRNILTAVGLVAFVLFAGDTVIPLRPPIEKHRHPRAADRAAVVLERRDGQPAGPSPTGPGR